jgi:16S rRNA (cytosine1402-N4)-methyltransferase
MSHIPVMAAEVIEALALKAGGSYVDATFGRGGYSQLMLAQGAQVIGLDRDPEAVAAGEKLAAANKNFSIRQTAFGAMADVLPANSADGVAFDLGVSSPQLDDAARGFSFSTDGPLDMRMDNRSGPSAADLVNHLKEAELADIIYKYGEEKLSRRIAAAIVAYRSEHGPITRTKQLAEIVRKVVRAKPHQIDGATRTFQALRIAVNDELGELERGLMAAEKILRAGGRLAVVSFHSLEDRIVKEFLRDASGHAPAPSRHVPVSQPAPARFKLIGKQPVAASEREASQNPRARSAKLRVAEKLPAGESA